MWDQTVRAAVQYPFGTGNAGFRDVLSAFQRYPSINFNSAHNYFLETLMTGGWWRLAVLLGLVLPMLWRAWRSGAWGLALGAAGLWGTLSFDVTGYMPSVMGLAFAALGATSQPAAKTAVARGFQGDLVLRWGVTAVTVALGVWWFAPCSDAVSCALTRHRGSREEITALAASLEPASRQGVLQETKRLNPRSLWVDNLSFTAATTALERLEVLRGITASYPVASPGYYLERARVAASLGLNPEAIKTLEAGLRIFPVGSVSAGVPLRGTDPLEVWSREAPILLARLRRP
ncbi:MAG: O-antigen ligase family protein [Pleurocapsa sp. SU_196_0]|nr:O-antigen ligase family protein [Pleurocapsa sp. SU_196_0]